MAISFLQSTVHNDAGGGQGTTISASLASGISAGSIMVVMGMFDSGSNSSVTVSNDKGDAVTDSGQGFVLNSNAATRSFCQAFLTPTAGAKTVTLTGGAGLNYCDLYVWEIAGLTGPVFDKVVSTATATSNTATTASTGTLSASAEAATAYTTVDQSASTGYSSPWTDDGATPFTTDRAAHQVVSANTALTATCTGVFTHAQTWLATFMSGGGGGSTTLTAAQGSFALTGGAVTFPEVMTSAQGSFTLTGEAVTFKEVMTSAQGSFTLTGEAAGLVQGTVLTAAQGSFALTGEAVTFPEVMPAAFGSFVETGEAATLTATGGGSTTLTAAFGSYALTGEAVVFAETLTSVKGSFALTGEAVVFAEVLTAARGSFVLTGEADLFPETMPATFGSFVLTGEAAGLLQGTAMSAAQGSFTETGEAVLFKEVMSAAEGIFVLTGEAAALSGHGDTEITASKGSFVLTGEAVTFGFSPILVATTGRFSLRGSSAILTWKGAPAAELVLTPYSPINYPKIDVTTVPLWHQGQNDQISASISALLTAMKAVDQRLRSNGI